MRRDLGLAALASFLLCGSGAVAQTRPIITIDRVTSERTCTLYQQSAGSAGVIATRNAIAAFASWRTWLVRDCVNNFAGLRASLEAALASSGRVVVGPGGRHILSVQLSELGSSNSAVQGAGYSVQSERTTVTMDVSLRDRTGRIVFGAPIVQQMETGSNIETAEMSSSGDQSGRTIYTQIQQQVAVAAARAIAFQLAPLRVVAVRGRQIDVDAGSPMLSTGSVLTVTSASGEMLRYVVSGAANGRSTAELDGDGDASRVRPGNLATVIDAGDPAAKGRRFRRVDLP